MVHSATGLLFSAVAGYWVLERAETHKQGNLRRLGRFLGWAVVIVSLTGVLCRVFSLASGYCGGMKKGAACPFTNMMGADTAPAGKSASPSH